MSAVVPKMMIRRPLVLMAASLVRPAIAFSTLSSYLKNPALLPSIPADTPTFDVANPADHTHIVAQVPLQTRQDCERMIHFSSMALPGWRDGTTAAHRASLLLRWSRLIHDNRLDIATIMTLESGKPLVESLGEVNYGASFLDYYAAEAIRPNNGGFLIPTPFSHPDGSPRGHVMAMQQAIGVTALITPWNFPIAMITRKVGPALAAGCTAIIKPSELTPLTAVALQTLAIEAGIPENVVQWITTDKHHTPDIGDALCSSSQIQKISFTGSTAVGKLLMKSSADTMKKLSLELGGNAPFVVFDDADVDQAVSAAMASKFRNAGQTCVCSDRFLVHASVHDEFVHKIVLKVQALKVGPGMGQGTTLGPLITPQAAQSVHTKVQEALAEGANCAIGGSLLPDLGPNFHEPTILTNVSKVSQIWKSETFGPVAAIRSFETEDEALAIANDCSAGLASYFCTKDLSRAFRFAKALECGIVGVNDGIISTASAPFGGIKESGLGREGSAMGLAEYLETKYVFLNC